MKKPKIELKNIKYAAFASEETNCYSASLYVDGKKLAEVSNDGKGGCDRVYPVNGKTRDDIRALEKVIKETYPSKELHGMTIEPDLEIVCGELLNRHLQKKDFKKQMKTVTYVKPGEKGVYSLPKTYKPTEDVITKLKSIHEWYNNVIVLNLLPEEEALELYLENG